MMFLAKLVITFSVIATTFAIEMSNSAEAAAGSPTDLITIKTIDPLGEPLRPRKFSNMDELRNYLDNLRKQYAHASRSRYGKRYAPPPAPDNSETGTGTRQLNQHDGLAQGLGLSPPHWFQNCGNCDGGRPAEYYNPN